MRKIYLVLFVMFLSCTISRAQNYNAIVNYNFNGTPTNGVKIKTNLPYVNSSQMPTVIIEGYNYGTGRPISINLVWYIYDGEFYSYGATSSGAYAPEIKLSNENGNVVIFINDRQYYQRFSIRAFAQGMSEVSSWFAGWTVVDEPLTGTHTVTLSYYSPVATVEGNVGIGTSNPENKLQIGVNNMGWHGNDLVVGNATGSIAIHNTPTESFVSGQHTTTLKCNGVLGVAVIANGNVGIGTLNPTAKFSVDGTVLAKKVKVSQSATDWPDYVFDSSYQLPSLDSVSTFIQANKHLPDMPSAATVEKDGHDLGEVQKLLLKKMEEMTLYMIELKKENTERYEALRKENEVLKAKIETLQSKK